MSNLIRGIASTNSIDKIMESGINWLPFLESILSKDDKILDFGAGIGRITIPLKERGYNIKAVERMPDRVNLLKQKGIEVFESDNFPKENFDVVLAMFVFQHMGYGKLKDLFNQSSKITKKMYFTIPTKDKCMELLNGKYYKLYDGNQDDNIFEWCEKSWVYTNEQIKDFIKGTKFNKIEPFNFKGVSMFIATI